jgi:hypothetical protein
VAALDLAPGLCRDVEAWPTPQPSHPGLPVPHPRSRRPPWTVRGTRQLRMPRAAVIPAVIGDVLRDREIKVDIVRVVPVAVHGAAAGLGGPDLVRHEVVGVQAEQQGSPAHPPGTPSAPASPAFRRSRQARRVGVHL